MFLPSAARQGGAPPSREGFRGAGEHPAAPLPERVCQKGKGPQAGSALLALTLRPRQTRRLLPRPRPRLPDENREPAARAPGMAREALRMPGTHRPPCRLPPRPAAGAPEPRAERGCRSRAGRAALRRDVPAGTRNASDDRSPFTVAVPRPGPSPQGPGAGLGPRHSPGPARLPGPEARERPRQRGAAPLPPRPRRGSTRRPDRGQARDGAGRVSQSTASSWR